MRLVSLLAGVGSLVFVGSCTGPVEPTGDRAACALTRPVAAPAEARAGSAITITGAGFVCDHRLPPGAHVVQVGLVMDDPPGYSLGEAPANADGSFELLTEIPPEVPPGMGTIVMSPPREMLPPCDLGGAETDCPATPHGAIEVVP